jgi:hypothetical protein
MMNSPVKNRVARRNCPVFNGNGPPEGSLMAGRYNPVTIPVAFEIPWLNV